MVPKISQIARHAFSGPRGDKTRYLPMEELERGFAELDPPRDRGSLALIVSRGTLGKRSTPDRVRLTPEGGVPGDTWFRESPKFFDAQLTVMRVDICRLFANGQGLSMPGDNLLVDLDLSSENLPAGSRLRLGSALLEVTPEPHNGCLKFKQRFGGDALRMTATPRYRDLHLRGIYMKVVEAGDVAVGHPIEVVTRGREAPSRIG